MKPIAVIGPYEAYRHLCYHCHLPSKNNGTFVHIPDVRSAQGMEFSAFIEAGNMSDININLWLELRQFLPTRVR